jgi:hypothetical protein
VPLSLPLANMQPGARRRPVAAARLARLATALGPSGAAAMSFVERVERAPERFT